MRTHVYTQAQIRLQFERTPVGCAAQIKGIKSGAAPPAVMEEKLVPKVTLLPASLHLTHLIFLCESSFLLLHLFPPPPMCRFLPLSSNTYFQNLFFCSGFPACFFFSFLFSILFTSWFLFSILCSLSKTPWVSHMFNSLIPRQHFAVSCPVLFSVPYSLSPVVCVLFLILPASFPNLCFCCPVPSSVPYFVCCLSCYVCVLFTKFSWLFHILSLLPNPTFFFFSPFILCS